MTSRRRREQLKLQILETTRLIEQVDDHPLMSYAFKQRLIELEKELATIPVDVKEPTVTLLFSGDPVVGSIGIDATFLGKALL